jgi:hypothetical protein
VRAAEELLAWVGGSVDASVSIHASAPPPWRRGQHAVDAGGEMRRVSVSCAEEPRPLDA